jgi:uncharacterized membrane protein
MEVKKDNEMTTQAAREEEEHIHLPPPSWAPIILALGMAGVVFGIVLTPILLVIGALLMVIGLGTWIMDEIRNASAADADAQGDGQAPHHAA